MSDILKQIYNFFGGETTEDILKRLKEEGFYYGNIDGIEGPQMKRALELEKLMKGDNSSDSIIDIQKRLQDKGLYHGLIDGIIGPATLRALELERQQKDGEDTSSSDDIKYFSPYDDNGNLRNVNSPECAYYANHILGDKYYSTGNAWNRNSFTPMFGTKISGYSGMEKPGEFSEQASNDRNNKAAEALKKKFDKDKLDKDSVYSVNMYFAFSPNKREAWENSKDGVTGTHTGNLYWNEKEGKWKVVHSIHGLVSDVPVESLLGANKLLGITEIAEVSSGSVSNWLAKNIGIFFKKGGNLNKRTRLIKKPLKLY